MATLADSHVVDGGSGNITVTDTTDIANTSGNLQVVATSHRTSSQTPTISNDTSGGGAGDWNGPYEIESEITDTAARRAIAWWWRIVPSDAGNFDVDYGAANPQELIVLEFNAGGGGTWQIDTSTTTADFANDSGTSGVTSLLSDTTSSIGSTDPVAVAFVTIRNGAPASQDEWSADSGWTVGPDTGSTGGPSENNLSLGSFYEFAGGAQSVTVSWSQTDEATIVIAGFSAPAAGGSLPAGRTRTATRVMLTR